MEACPGALRRSPLFRGMEEAQIRRVVDCLGGRLRTLPGGGPVLRAGDPATHRISALQVISSPSHWMVQSPTPMRSSSFSRRSRLDFQKGASSCAQARAMADASAAWGSRG